jgi:hypothetical protein
MRDKLQPVEDSDLSEDPVISIGFGEEKYFKI